MGESTDTLVFVRSLGAADSEGAAAQRPSCCCRCSNDSARRPPVAEGGPVESHFWLTRGDQVTFGLLSFVALILLGVYWVRLSNWGTRTVEIERLPARQSEFRIDANSATWVEWGQIQGIGDGLARRIVADREQNGPFRSVDDLARVKGIGPKTLEHLRPWVRVRQQNHRPANRRNANARAPIQDSREIQQAKRPGRLTRH